MSNLLYQLQNSFLNVRIGIVKGYVTTEEAAQKLGISVRRVVALINSGNLPSERIGRSHVIKESDLELVKDRKPGRPAKNKINK